jgi:hypothetical protein
LEPNEHRFGIVLAGMHHSGSSPLARALAIVGCDLAGVPTREGAAGSAGESAAIVTLNDDILAAEGSNAGDWRPLGGGVGNSEAAEFRARAREILDDEFGSSPLFVINDARVSRVLDFWVASLEAEGVTPLIVSPVRDPRQVVSALGWRGALDSVVGPMLWLRYVLDAEAASRRLARCYVRYPDLRDDWRSVVDRIGRELGITWPVAPQSVEREAVALGADERPDVEEGDRPRAIPDQAGWATPVFEILDRWGCSEFRDEDAAALDAVRSAVDVAASVFGPAVTLGQQASRRSLDMDRRDAARQIEREAGLNDRAALQGRVESLEAQVAALHASTSWRVTAPLRSLGEIRAGIAQRRHGRPQHVGEPSRVASTPNAGGHDGDPATTETDVPLRVSDRAGSGPDGPPREAATLRPSRPRERSLVWLYRRDVQKSGLMMRGRQLSEMVRRRLGDSVAVRYVSEQETSPIRGAVVIVTRSFLANATVAELEVLRAGDNVICVDYIDWPVREEFDEVVDVYIASSIKQFAHYRKRYPKKLVHHVTHHADPAIAEVVTPTEYCNIGYFGEIGNALHRKALQGYVDFVQTNNSEYRRRDWLHRLRHCNVHYSVRDYTFPVRGPRPGSFKPFTKGFTAAQCNANIIVPRNESDAEHYLDSDYPYLLPDDSLASVWAMIDYVRESFRGPEWYRGLERMAWVRRHCSTEYIVGEVQDLLRRCGR